MRERIEKFIEAEKLTAAEFADKIGVQRSNVSHVLHGRNNPGFSFIQKILEAYPLLNSRWLLTGQGSIYEKKQEEPKNKAPEYDLFSTVKSQEESINKQPVTINKNKPEVKQEQENEPAIKPVRAITPQASANKKISKVLIFYTDHTFDDYSPAE